MEVTGIMLAMLDVPAERSQDYNRWYDLDHMPEHVSKADVVAGRRYVAPPALRELEGIDVPEFGHAPFLTVYCYGGPLDFTSAEAWNLWIEKDKGIARQGRYWLEGDGVHSSRWRLEHSVARPSCLVSESAIPYLAHRGVIVALGRGPAPDRRQEAVDWWERTHLVDLFSVPGVLAAMRFGNVLDDPDAAGQVLHLLLCDDAPAEVLPRIEAVKRYGRSVGRYPAYRGAYESVAFLPYERIVPLEYDFEI